MGRGELLLKRLGPDDPTRQPVQLMVTTGERAVALTHQLLAFSRKQVLQPRVLDLTAIAAGMQAMLRRLIGEDIELIFSAGPALGRVKADPGQLEQAIMNLVVNSRDAMPQGGRLTLATSNAELDEAFVRRHRGAVAGSYVMLAVRDTGVGMDIETQAQIFEPFFTTKEPGKGTGLGLATVYGIVKQHEGYIAVDSEPCRGTTVEIYLPRVAAVEEVEPHAQHAEPPRGTETVLIVEDEGPVRDLACEILRERGYTVLEARDGVEALEVSAGYGAAIQLLVTDVVMPRMSGRALADRLAAERSGMGVLYMSGYTDDAIVHHGVKETGTVFLHKPFTAGTLAHAVRDALDGPRADCAGESTPRTVLA